MLICLLKWNAFLWSLILDRVFLCRSFSDSCFLSSPLCSELADVQWYGHDKAKPGTLVWDLLIGPRKVPLPSPTASPLSLTTTHRQPTTSSLRPYKNPALTELADWTWASLLPKSCPPSISPPLYYALLIQLSWMGTHSLGSGKGWFHRTDWEVPPQLLNCCPAAPQSPSFTHPQHTSNGARGKERWEERAQKNIKQTT